MPECQAFGCNNHQGEKKRGGTGKSFFIIPNPRKNPAVKELAGMWLHRIGTGHTVQKFNFGPRKLVCEDHFEESCFIEDIRAKVMGTKPQKRLKPDAVPTLFTHRKRTGNHKRRHRLAIRTVRKELGRFLVPDAGGPSHSIQLGQEESHSEPETQVIDDPSSPDDLLPLPDDSEDICMYQPLLMCDASTQTEGISGVTVSCQTEDLVSPEMITALARLDHAYCAQPEDPETPPGTSAAPSLEEPGPVQEQQVEVVPASDEVDQDILPFVDNQRGDPTFQPEESLQYSSQEVASGSVVQEEKFIVFESALDTLFHNIRCGLCEHHVTHINKHHVGSGLVATLFCNEGHEVLKWSSQPFSGKMPLGNLLCSAAIMFSGLTYQRVKSFANFLNLALFSAPVFNEIQRNYLIPEVNDFWAVHQKATIESLQGAPIDLAGDGRCDSPGYCAKYCSYSLMDVSSEKIVDMELVQCSETGNSVRMEAEGFRRCFERVRGEHNLVVKRFASDRHTSIRKICRTEYADVIHNFDLFHLAKNITGSLRKVAKLKCNADLELWLKSISNHLWFCSRTCDSNVALLIEMWRSLLYHVTGVHSWAEDESFKVFKACQHPPLTVDLQRRKKWLKLDSSSYEALKKVVLDKKLLRDLPYIAEFMHTGSLEVFHNVVLKYAPKRLEFNFPQMEARLMLAALDHNLNVGRAKAVVKKPRAGSSPKGEAQYKCVFTKFTKQWLLKAKYEEKTFHHVFEMMEGVVRRKSEGRKGNVRAAPTPNIAPSPVPARADLIASHRSRFKE